MKRILLPFLLIGGIAWSQVTDVGTIYSQKMHQKSSIPTYKLPAFDMNLLQKEDAINDKLPTKPFRFGKEFPVDIQPTRDGLWTTLPNGDRLWQIVIESKDAQTLNFVFDQYQLSPNAKLYMHNEAGQFLGYYGAKENNDTKEVGSWLIDGDKITIEFYEPFTEIGQSTFRISKAVHGYRSVKNIKDYTKDLNSSGDCNIDANCAAGDNWDDQKQAVALILSGSSAWCSGTLINNTAEDGTPYFLTADHCINSRTPNWTFRFKWISENPDCGTTAPSGDGPRVYSMSGAEIVARSANTDFALLKLRNEIPEEWELSWAGWDRTGTPPTEVTGLHHPAGDIMKISQYYSSPTISNRYGVKNWEIPKWDLGVTEGGSSGSALFNQDGLLVGQLYGGESACAGTNPNTKNDNYGRFDVSWEGGGTPTSRLKDWLDPNNTNATTLEVYKAQEKNFDLGIASINIASSCEETVNPTIDVRNAGLEKAENFTLVYQYNQEEEKTITWNGSLEPKSRITINLPEKELVSGNHELKAKIIYDKDENLKNNERTKVFHILESHEVDKVTLTLRTDYFGDETKWKVYDSKNAVVQSGSNYSNNQVYTIDINLPKDDCYTFEITDSGGDGICCAYGQGFYKLTTENGTILAEGGNFSSSESTVFKIRKKLGINTNDIQKVSIYPNPTKDNLTISTPQNFGEYEYKIYSSAGQLLLSGKGETETQLSMKGFGKGNYTIQLKNDKGEQISKKVLVK
ncbi:T9SS type A sorting domain-containing protein [Weeksella virosa]|uniref:T9SS type A sorting domain-containing protein n=1 Tax=Weeksella virosa TaxID=1014 RepID=UPI002555C57D|nr:T9SS type A sorting domain-containing protein [Weeksella virosa]MDK7374671.1 T9SS type A sorting domain-containing protein [Weeksella virosa]